MNQTPGHIRHASAQKPALRPMSRRPPAVSSHRTQSGTPYPAARGQATSASRMASTFPGPSPRHRPSCGTQACASSQRPLRTHSQKNPKSRSREAASSSPKGCILPAPGQGTRGTMPGGPRSPLHTEPTPALGASRRVDGALNATAPRGTLPPPPASSARSGRAIPPLALPDGAGAAAAPALPKHRHRHLGRGLS